jgi:tetraacyldisaccharide 4'-kinase
MKAPLFWYRQPGFLSTFLWPLGWLYGKGVKILAFFKKSHPFPLPILSVGNIVCGGAGKTPTAMALADLLQKKGWIVHFVTRGYKGSQKGPLKVDPACHSSSDVGDEPLLLAQQAPTWVAKKRHLGVRKALEKGAQIIILDDGHQTSTLQKDISFVVTDFLQGFGNGRVIPAGPLREELREGLRRADALIGIGEGAVPTSKAFFRARCVPQPLVIPSNKVIAFCGLGFPQKFYSTLKELSVDLIATESFPDHYTYRQEDLLRLQKLAKRHQAVLVTTRKDLIKISSSWQVPLHVLDINIQFEDPQGMYDFILQKIPSLKERP